MHAKHTKTSIDEQNKHTNESIKVDKHNFFDRPIVVTIVSGLILLFISTFIQTRLSENESNRLTLKLKIDQKEAAYMKFYSEFNSSFLISFNHAKDILWLKENKDVNKIDSLGRSHAEIVKSMQENFNLYTTNPKLEAILSQIEMTYNNDTVQETIKKLSSLTASMLTSANNEDEIKLSRQQLISLEGTLIIAMREEFQNDIKAYEKVGRAKWYFFYLR
jgi:hypothetical protein